MKVFRLCNRQFSSDLSGKGAKIFGGRWNNKGTAILYTSESRALCLAEVLVRATSKSIPDDYHLVTIELPDNHSVLEVGLKNLPLDWKRVSYKPVLQRIGDSFVQTNEHLILKVPSVVIPAEFNYLINPRHPGFGKVSILNIEPFEFDERLFISK
jgi:RES domain-containing protein